MEIIMKRLGEIKPYEKNPRKNDDAVDYVASSIREFGFKVPIVIDKNNVIVAGHTRLKAAEKLGLSEVPCIMADDLSDDQVKAFRLADNKVAEFAGWDFELRDSELDELSDAGWDMEEFGFLELNDYEMGEPAEKRSLNDRFVVPPFSVLDTRQGYWRDRRKSWAEKTGDLSETRDGEFGKFGGAIVEGINGGTSNFDPVLAEVMYKWFCPKSGRILDPFGGEQTKGVVAGELGFYYAGVEIRREQVELNRKKCAGYGGIKYVCGDSNDIDKLLEGEQFDFMFTSPPYYDLEVYSKDDLSALGTYEEFMEQYKNIFAKCYQMLKPNRFAAIKVAEIRDKATGEYRNFVADTISVFREVGFKYYNEIILVNAVGTARLRAARSMRNRKVVKLHQNVLVFYKGDLNRIQEDFPVIEYEETDFDDGVI